MPLQQLLNQQSFRPDEIKVLSSVFEEALRHAARSEAHHELAQQGERDPTRLREGAVKGF